MPNQVADAGEEPGRRPATLAEARALAHPLRQRILRLCLDQARTNAQLAAALGERPATVLYHVRTLARTGFLAVEPYRSGPRGTVEKPYRATGKSWRLDRTIGGEDTATLRAILQAVAAEVDEAGSGAIVEAVRMALRLRPEQLADLADRIRGLVASYPHADGYLAAPAEPGADPYALLVVLHKRGPSKAGLLAQDTGRLRSDRPAAARSRPGSACARRPAGVSC